MVYMDSSALVKRYAVEKGCRSVSTLVDSGEEIATTRLTYVETLAALARKKRAGQVEEAHYRAVRDRFLDDWSHFNAADLGEKVLERCRGVVELFPLRGPDAVQLATALEFQSLVSKTLLFVSSDQRLLDAARKSGLRTLDPEEG